MKSIIKTFLCGMLPLLATTLFASEPAAPSQGKPVSVLLIGQSSKDVIYSPIADRLAEEGINVGVCGFGQVTPVRLARYNAVMIFDMSVQTDTEEVSHIQISPEGFKKVSEALDAFVKKGGGLYVFGVSFTHSGNSKSAQTLNEFLQAYDARIPFEQLQDPAREARQPEGGKVLYAQSDKIAAHPATAGVRNYWYPIGQFSYGPWARPLVVGPAWTPLIFTSAGATATPIDPVKEYNNFIGTPSEVKSLPAAIYAVREVGEGRMILNSGESTISFFGYGSSDRFWERVGMERGLNGIPSDGLALMVSSLKWLAEPSQASGALGGYVRPPKPPFKPRVARPVVWNEPQVPEGATQYYKGIFGPIPALGGGSGTVAEWVEAAKAQGLEFLVLSGDFAKMERPAWDQLVSECEAASSESLTVTPAMITRDEQDNTFLQAGPKSWPESVRLSTKDPKRVLDHLGYWMLDANFPLRAALLFSRGKYPDWLHSAYDTFAVRTYEGGKLVEDRTSGFLKNEEQGDRSRLISVTLMTKPEELADAKEWTYVTDRDFVKSQFQGGAISYSSSAPKVLEWSMVNGNRNTFGEKYVPGTERWRAILKVQSEAGLKSVTIHDGTAVVRRYAVSGQEATLTLDGVHDTRHVLAAVIEDVNGGRAMTGALETLDSLFLQFFCSDRCNLMSGQSTIRDADGHEKIIGATSMLYKAGRLNASTYVAGEILPGIDGGGGAIGSTRFALYPNFYLSAEDGKGEERSPVHQINRPYENGDCIIFDTPILKRSSADDSLIYGHAPYVDLEDPKVDARLIQYHFYRNSETPAVVLSDFSTTVTDPNGLTLERGWNGFSARYAGSWSDSIKTYLVLRRDGTQESGPAEDESSGSRWTGRLEPGDSFILPEIQEGFVVLDQPVDLVVECRPSEKWFRLYVGRVDTETLPAGTTLSTRLAMVKLAPTSGEAVIGNWTKLRDEYGMTGQAPAYKVNPTQGTVAATRYMLELAAKDNGFAGAISKTALPQPLPVKVTGLNDKWTAGKVNLVKNQWTPLGVWQGAAYTTVDTSEGDHQLYIGNLVMADNPEVLLTLLPANEGGATNVEVHNPTDREITVKVTVPVATYLASKQQQSVTVPSKASTQVKLDL